MQLSRRSLLRLAAQGAGLAAASILPTACGVAPTPADGGDGSGTVETPAPLLDAHSGVLATLTRTAGPAYDMRASSSLDADAPGHVRTLWKEAAKVAPNGPSTSAYVARRDAEHPLHALVGFMTRHPARPDWYISTTLHSFGSHEFGEEGVLAVPTVVQIGLNLLMLHSSGADNVDDVFSTKGMNTVRHRSLVELRTYYLLKSHVKLEGEDALHLPSVHRVMTTSGHTVRIEWSPSADDPTQGSRLSLVKGFQKKDRPLDPLVSADFGMPFETIFGSAGSATSRS